MYSQSQRQPALPPLPPPPLPRKPMNLSELPLSRPPIPPKLQAGYSSSPSGLSQNISFYPHPLAGAIRNEAESSATQPPKPIKPDKDSDLALALAVSASERGQELSNADDEDKQLARALEESRLMAEASTPPIPVPSPVGSQIIPPDMTPTWVPGMPMPEPSTPGVQKAIIPPSPVPHPFSEVEINPMDKQSWLTSSPKYIGTQLSDDAAFARRLAAEDSEQSRSNQQSSSQENGSSEPPLYTPAVSGAANASEPQPSYALSVSSSDSRPGAANNTSLPRENSFVSASSLDTGRRSSDTQLVSQVLTVPNGSLVARPATTDTSNLSVPSSTMTTHGRMRPTSSMASLSSLNASVSDGSSGITANPFVEKELLLGVCTFFLSSFAF